LNDLEQGGRQMSTDEHGTMTHDNLTAHALAVLDANRYLVLGTIDPDGRPWTSPVRARVA
jgi:Pyridoxamine 5'-phosphate oxidase